MANEVIGKQERYIIISVDEDGVEKALFQDMYNGGFSTVDSDSLNIAKDFETRENAEKVAEAMNSVYQITKQPYTLKVVHEVTERELISRPEA